MSYDGPSFYRKNIENPQRNNEKTKELTNSMESWHQKEVKNNQSPPPATIEQGFKKKYENTNRKEHFFRSRKIPKSLQNLAGWKKTEWDYTLLVELEKRLSKQDEDYLLFAVESDPDDLVDEKTHEESRKSKKQVKNHEKINEVQKKMKKDLSKPATGLHRSLSKIIAEDQKALKNGKNNLNRLFNNE